MLGGRSLQQTGLPKSRLPALGSVPFADRRMRGTHVRKVVIISVELPAIEKRLSFPCANEVVVRMRSWNFREHHGCERHRNGSKYPLHLRGGWVAVTNNNGDVPATANKRVEGECERGRNEVGWGNLKLMAKAVLSILRYTPGFRVHAHSRCRRTRG